MKHSNRTLNRVPFYLCALLVLAVSACSDDTNHIRPEPDLSAEADADVGGDAYDGGDADASVAVDWTVLDDPIERQMEQAHIAGLAAAVVVNGEVAWTGAYGLADVDAERPVTVDTPFMLASISKTVTGVALMQLVEDGVIDLDDEIDDHLPFAVDNPRVEGETILVRHLATHTSGIRDNWNNIPYVEGDSPIALGPFVEGYLVPGGDWYDAEQNFYAWAAGTRMEYGNVATALEGFVVETAGGAPFDDHCDAEIFEPLGMSNTGWHLADFEVSDVAVPYYWSDDGDYVSYGQYGYPDYPDGQLRASVSDVARFLAAITAGGELDGRRILEEATVAQMLLPYAADVDDTQFIYWYSTEIAGRDVIGHNGGDDGVATDMYFDPSTGIGFVLLMNVDWTRRVENAAADIEELLFYTAEGA